MTDTTKLTEVDLLIQARWIIPVDDQNSVLQDHSVAVADGKILAIMPSTEAHQRYLAREQLTLPDHVLMPGLVNTHGHAAMSLLRGIADDLPLQVWLEQHIWPLEARWVSDSFVYTGTRLAIAEMLRGGTTCFADMYFFPEASARAAVEAGIRAQLAAPVIDFPTPWAASPEEGISKIAALAAHWRGHPLVSIAFGPHAPYSVSDAPLRRVAELADSLDIPVHMHVHETAGEVEQSVAQLGMRPIRRLAQLGLLSPRLLCVHATALNEEDISLLRDSGAHVVHCPQSNLKLASGFCQVQRLLDAGINVALGTDGAASNNDLDMFSELGTAAMLAKAVAGDAAALPAHAALRMATLNGARAMGLDHLTGSLTPGKQADMIAVRMNELNAMPVYHPASHLTYSTRSDQVSHVWIDGKAVLVEGEHQTVDIAELKQQINHWQQRLQENA
jgi:5-methylthioadenosine/S-adenosylhomocysteine deaminase